ncbi:GNAT family N-acetyltransferase [Peribacillus sp. B-H-3]|uniref:GNAT family N-acetyltransferase n=1 Tax=Peribacillus sp. B-H-3 TaxID=3400420 RepID=UPI003B02B1FF
MSWVLKKFSELTNHEIYRILEERTRVFVVEQNCPYLEADGKDTACYHLFLEEEGVMQAYLRVVPPGVSYKQASLGRVLVKKEFRGNGLAHELIKRGIEFVQHELRETVIKIQAQAYLEDFYGSFGFKAISEPYIDDYIPHIDMLLSEKRANNIQ